MPEFDATVVANLRRAGAIILGKLNMSEFAMGDPISSYYGAAHNPWDLERNPGTSSTGSGAATAGFLCATSLGEDTGGSIRGAGRQLRPGGYPAHLGPGKPVRRGRSVLVGGYHRSYFPDRCGLRGHHWRHCRL